MVTRDEIVWAYRMILGRDPESESAIAAHSDHHDRESLRLAFMDTREFREREGQQPVIGRYVHATDVNVQVNCSPADMTKMLAQISREWRKFGETDPHWSVLTVDKFRGETIAEHLDEFYASGHGDIDQLLAMVRRYRPDARHFDKVLDLGCGVGRLMFAMADHAGQVTGIDISPPHLGRARERATAMGITNVRFDILNAVSDLTRYRDYDLVYSLIVLQHNPPPVMAALFTGLLSTLRKGGLALIQVPTYFPDRPFSAEKYLAEAQPAMEMNALPQADVFRLAAESDCRILEVREDNRVGEGGLSHLFLMERC